ncbi:uncharacterized protein PV07_07288 [Cladophialophora immunda]|uniref:Uncharacterized protein n=1 Tax=Cladophialophora immunda TaxID=569365 RepID=A0A0D2CV57_9EURO|nr:uncharacterized protein PV07_07288 [Cladophialophora immunda]KIW27559.1 hypothetical protein PV07_07288 [Cladophialophora immunda]OQU97416.1 hypothetical protein CLAIMM_03348 [Cladophialophora immunda]
MDNETLLKYELAEIELDKRQLQLERRELGVKRRLEQLKRRVDLTDDNADSTEDHVVVKSEADPGDADKIRAATQNRSSAEQQTDTIAASPAAEDTPASPVENTAVERLHQKVDKGKSETGKEKHRTTLDSRKWDEARSDHELMGRQAFSCEQEEQSTIPVKPLDSHEELLAAFRGRPPTHPANVPATRRQSRLSDNLTVSSESDADSETSYSPGRQDSRAKRRRISQNAGKQLADVSGPITKSQQYSLVRHYTGLLLKRMAAVESSLPPDCSQKPTVASKMRRTTNGSTHHTLTLLHEEFEMTVRTYAKHHQLRRVLMEDLDKFDEAQRYWWPKCTALTTQQERTSFIDKVFHDIASSRFSKQEFEVGHGAFENNKD